MSRINQNSSFQKNPSAEQLTHIVPEDAMRKIFKHVGDSTFGADAGLSIAKGVTVNFFPTIMWARLLFISLRHNEEHPEDTVSLDAVIKFFEGIFCRRSYRFNSLLLSDMDDSELIDILKNPNTWGNLELHEGSVKHGEQIGDVNPWIPIINKDVSSNRVDAPKAPKQLSRKERKRLQKLANASEFPTPSEVVAVNKVTTAAVPEPAVANVDLAQMQPVMQQPMMQMQPVMQQPMMQPVMQQPMMQMQPMMTASPQYLMSAGTMPAGTMPVIVYYVQQPMQVAAPAQMNASISTAASTPRSEIRSPMKDAEPAPETPVSWADMVDDDDGAASKKSSKKGSKK